VVEQRKGADRSQLSLDVGAGAPAEKQPRVHTVTRVVQLASREVERFGTLWVAGEVSNLRSPSSGHLYFTLKDRRAQLAVVMFRSAAARLAFRPENGQTLRLRGRLTIYEVQGRFQLNAEHAEPTGLGALQQAVERLKRKLQTEGLFAAERKRPLPLLPTTVAVVTSRTGAALRDILRVLERRFPVRVVLCPTPVQGSGAPFEICSALRRADALGADVIIVGRGGGSAEDLQAFNSEQVARTIGKMRTVVVSAVGHEVDVSIADLVADQRAPTPSSAAELVVPSQIELVERLSRLRGGLQRATRHQLRRHELHLERLRGRLGTPQALVDRGRLRVDELAARVDSACRRRLALRREALRRLQLQLHAQRPTARLVRQRAQLQQLEHRLTLEIRARLRAAASALGSRVAALEAMSPLAVLARGYALVRDERGRLLLDADDVAVGHELDVRLRRGELRCRVERKIPRP